MRAIGWLSVAAVAVGVVLLSRKGTAAVPGATPDDTNRTLIMSRRYAGTFNTSIPYDETRHAPQDYVMGTAQDDAGRRALYEQAAANLSAGNFTYGPATGEDRAKFGVQVGDRIWFDADGNVWFLRWADG